MELQATRDDVRVAWLTAMALTIHLFEAALPSPVPGVKPGLANIITIVALLRYGWRVAAWVSLLRVVVGGLLAGTFLSPTFLLSLSGALASLAAIAVAMRIPGLTAIGYSVLAALAHMGAQFAVAYRLFVPHPGLFTLLPPMMSLALMSGLLNGIIAHAMAQRLTER